MQECDHELCVFNTGTCDVLEDHKCMLLFPDRKAIELPKLVRGTCTVWKCQDECVVSREE